MPQNDARGSVTQPCSSSAWAAGSTTVRVNSPKPGIFSW